MNLVTSTSSHLQTLGETFSVKDQYPVMWSAASFTFRLKLSLNADWGPETFFTLQWFQTLEAVAGTSFHRVPWFTAFLSLFDHIHVPERCGWSLFFSCPTISPAQRHKANCPKWFSAAAFGKTCFKNWMCAFVQYTYCKVLTCNNSSYLTFMLKEMLDRRLHFSRCLSVHGRSVTSYSLRSAECFKWGF